MRTDKQLAAITMLQAFAAANRAYYYDAVEENLSALQACQDAVTKMLQPYYMEEDHAKVG